MGFQYGEVIQEAGGGGDVDELDGWLKETSDGVFVWTLRGEDVEDLWTESENNSEFKIQRQGNDWHGEGEQNEFE